MPVRLRSGHHLLRQRRRLRQWPGRNGLRQIPQRTRSAAIKVEIGSKFGYDFYTDPGEAGSHRERKQDFSPKFLRIALEQSLQRLGVEYIDLYMAHNIKLPQFRDDMFAELEKVKDEGKIKVWGVSLGPAIGWREEGIKAMIDHGAKAVQTVYNLFEQNPGREFCEAARRHARAACWPACTTTAASSRTSSRSTRPSAKTITANSATSPGKSTA